MVLEIISAVLWRKEGYILDIQQPSNNLELSVNLASMPLDCGRELKHLQGTHTEREPANCTQACTLLLAWLDQD